ncbi:uncharacterized protein N0V89_006308 [Didymosphaeria variabile]|uniref:LIM zinc-binding domain-containing protein n=1 Tax=Didymosphaeria variabile TaxID=1932322 RepID=A0A9W8XMM5_9PLEO|nr:uncharacterized protein N0V89_006308 [Didymosphaeria variabile]KAJ4354571.1 hypothetical protein N0V89_006308 [Didymosphaeria variabile]
MTNYLQDLRTNRPARPTGSRPPPAHFNTWSSRSSNRFSDSPAISPLSHPTFEEAGCNVDAPPASTTPEPKLHRRATSNMSLDEMIASTGRPLVQPPRGRDMSTSATARERTPSVQYRESARRQVEKDEVHALRAALDEADLKSEEKLYEAARDEAAELVWKHINPNAPGANPDAPYAYPGLTRKGSVQRSQSLDRSEQDLQRTNSKLRRKRNSMGSTSGSRSSSLQSRRAGSGSSLTANAAFSTSPTKASFNGDKAEDSAILPKASSTPSTSHRKVSDPNQKRRSSSGSRRRTSASLFKNPNDQIYEEPEEEQAAPPPPAVTNPPAPAKLPLGVRRNPFARVQTIKDKSLVRSNTDPIVPMKRFDRFEIQRNPPSQSRNAAYTSNSALPRTSEDGKSDAENDPEVKKKDGKEIRSDELRAATGFKLKDRSGKLPTPTMVSDSPGRPIVSFKKEWKPKEIVLKEETSALPAASPRPLSQATRGPRPLSKAATAPIVPTISTHAEPPKKVEPPTPAPTPAVKASATPSAPSTRVNRAQIPAISVFEDPPARPLPSVASSRKVNTPPQNAAPTVPTINVSQAPSARPKPSSAHSLPTIAVQETPSISVSAPSGSFSLKNRKLPSTSATPIPTISHLECVAFYPEPSLKHAERVSRIRTRQRGEDLPMLDSHPTYEDMQRLESEDGHDESLRFYCHLDFHELFSPRCKSCKTPIEGEVVVACGAEWHVGHFFCAQCGDPFDSSTPFVEKEGKCRKPITETVVKALGAEWHINCFVCMECSGPFEDGRYFLRGESEDPVCMRCEERRLKA